MQEDSGMMISITPIREKARREHLCLNPLLLQGDFSGFEQFHAEGLNQDHGDTYPGVGDLFWAGHSALPCKS